MNRLIATFGYVGYLRPAPGTWGSLTAIPFAWALHCLGGPVLLALATVGVFFLGWFATHAMTNGASDHDPSEIVIDEVVGQWIPFCVLSFAASHADVALGALWPGWIAAFALFRAFDILKPGPVGWFDRRNDAFGVMMDDVAAGILAAVGVILMGWLWHGVLGA